MRTESIKTEDSRVIPSFVPTKQEMEESRQRISELLTRESFFNAHEIINKVGTSEINKSNK